MAWKKMRLRSDDVFVRVDDNGEPRAEGGRVEIRYKPDSMRAYHAALRNLSASTDGTVFPDAHCTSLEGVEVQSTLLGGAAPTAATKSASPSAAKKAAKPKVSESAATASTPPAASVSGGAVIAYADGACSGNPGPCGLGLVILDGARRLERSEYLGTGTNNIAELTGIRRALEAIPAPRPLAIHTDSQYSIGVLTKGWKPKANQTLIAEIKALLAGRKGVSLRYVPGHAGVALNERADELAREAVRSRKTVEKVDGPRDEPVTAEPSIRAASASTPATSESARSPRKRPAKSVERPTRSGR